MHAPFISIAIPAAHALGRRHSTSKQNLSPASPSESPLLSSSLLPPLSLVTIDGVVAVNPPEKNLTGSGTREDEGTV